MYRRRELVAVASAALCVILLLRTAFAAVVLVSFRAEPTSNNAIQVIWEVSSELETIGYRLYRSTTDLPLNGDWGPYVHTQPVDPNALGEYHYTDNDNIVPGDRYYYLLEEVTSSSDLIPLEKTSAGVGLPTDTPTPTATATLAGSSTATATRTFTPQPSATTRYTVPTPTTPAPTATRKYTDAPPTAPPVTPSPTRPPTATPFPVPTATPLPPARVASPTGRAPLVTLPAATMPTLTPELVKPVTPLPTETPTPELAAIAEGPEETATPLPTKDVTPIIFSAEARGNGSPTPQDAGQVAGQNSSSLALIVGGSAVGLAALLAAVLLFLRSRRA